MTLTDRAQLQTNPIAKKLFQLMATKQTNLSVSADVTRKAELLQLADLLGPEICVLKTHLDIIEDSDRNLTQQLRALADHHNFLIFEDRKFADIGNTTRLQYEAGPFNIASWADIVNFHLLPGPGILAGLKSAKGKPERGYLILAEMSSADNLFTPEYTQACVTLAEKNPDDVFGFIAAHRLSTDPRFITMTPGVKLTAGLDSLGQRYRTPHVAIAEQGCDIIIVGRGIITARDPLATARAYREASWCAYSKPGELPA